MNQFSCFKCGTVISWSAQFPISRRDTCPKCASDTRVCRNCRHHDTSSRWECREHIQEAVRDKERANMCEAFQAKDSLSSSGAAGDSKEDLLKKAEALFKKN